MLRDLRETLASETPIVFICESNDQLDQIERELRYLLPESPIFLFPEWNTIPYDRISPEKSVMAKRVLTNEEIKINKDLARTKGEKIYFGATCKKNPEHGNKRYLSEGSCVECAKIRGQNSNNKRNKRLRERTGKVELGSVNKVSVDAAEKNREQAKREKKLAEKRAKKQAKLRPSKTNEDKTIPLDQVITLDHLTNPEKK